jgi:hypothetical protein
VIAGFVKFLLAMLVAAAGVLVVICAVTGRWPAIITVRNDVERVSCALAFSDGWTWDVDLEEDQKKFWIFLLGKPDSVDVACRTPVESIAFKHYFCGPRSEYVLTVSPKAGVNNCPIDEIVRQ